MYLRQILGMLAGVSGPNASGEYTAKCPAHEDRTASLTLSRKASRKDGKMRVYLCCHAGCAQDAVMGALGITARDLIVDPDDGNGSGAGAEKTQRGSRNAAGSHQGGTSAGAAKKQRTGRPGNPTDDDVPDDAPGVYMDPETGKAYAVGGRTGGADPEGGAAKKQRGVKTETIGGITVHTTGTEGMRSGTGSAGAGGAGDAGGEKKPEMKIDWDHPDRIYSYTDGSGNEVFQVVRYHYLNAEGKTFRQRMKPTPEMRREKPDLKVNREGYVASVPAEIRDRIIYRLENVKKAISEKKPVYVVEGEKDVETLERLGYCATCNPGGATKAGDAGGCKWKDGHSAHLLGADVIILPDNDGEKNGYTGQNHAYDVAMKLQHIAGRVRLVDLKAAFPDLPEKGDISDMVAMMGDTGAMDALARQVAVTRTFDPSAVPFWLTPLAQADRIYRAVTGYCADNGCISQINGTDIKPLCDFVVIPRAELIRDDGMTRSLFFQFDGWNSSGVKLGRVTIPAGSMDTMNWVTEQWGFRASVAPGTATKGKVAWAIKKAGQMTAAQVTEYAHTGWRRIDGKLCYLYQGGAIGMEGVTVNLGDALKTYRLDGSGAEGFDLIPIAEAARTSLRIQQIMKPVIGVALLGTMYLAPLREFLVATDVVPAFALFLYGESGTHKSTAGALAMAHFGNFHGKNLPASFSDTANLIRTKAFVLKDIPIFVDDFHPTGSIQEKRQMAATAQALSRAFGDGADRGRLNADTTIKASRPPRSVAVISGEDLPNIGASGLARFFIVDIDEGDIPVGEEMTEMQELARKGWLQRAMRGYIQWLLGQADKLPEMLHGYFLRFREDIRKETSGVHDRAPEAVASILIGYTMMLKYFVSIGIFDARAAEQMAIQARRQLLAASKRQGAVMEAEKPSRIFLDSLSEMISSGRVAIRDLNADKIADGFPTEKMIGYMDQNYYYLLPNVTFGAVSSLCREQGVEFPVSLKALYKHLKTDGILPRGEEENPTRLKRMDLGEGKSLVKRVLWIPVEQISAPRVHGSEQQYMDLNGKDVPLPEEWKE